MPCAPRCYDSVIDTLALARETFPGKRNNLDALCERFGVSNAHRTLHGALLDAELLAEVYLAMTRGQETLTIDMGAHRRRPCGPYRIHRRRRARAPPLLVLARTPRSSPRTRPISRHSNGNRTAMHLAAAGGCSLGLPRPTVTVP